MLGEDKSFNHPLSIVGVKPANSTLHAYGRIIAVILLICIIVWGIYFEEAETVQLEDLSHIIKKNSIMYNSITELDSDSQQKYVKMLNNTFNTKPNTMFSKYYKSVIIAVITAICSDYIINGNLHKPLGGVAKTIISTAWTTSMGA